MKRSCYYNICHRVSVPCEWAHRRLWSCLFSGIVETKPRLRSLWLKIMFAWKHVSQIVRVKLNHKGLENNDAYSTSTQRYSSCASYLKSLTRGCPIWWHFFGFYSRQSTYMAFQVHKIECGCILTRRLSSKNGRLLITRNISSTFRIYAAHLKRFGVSCFNLCYHPSFKIPDTLT